MQITRTRRYIAPAWLRRLRRTGVHHPQNLWSTLLILATLATCAWVATTEPVTPPAAGAASTTGADAATRG